MRNDESLKVKRGFNSEANKIMTPGRDRTPVKKSLKIVRQILDNTDKKLTRIFAPWALRHPRYLRAFIRLARSYKQSQKLWEDALTNGFKVPPFLILSITSRCNLRCAGCFADAVGTVHNEKSKANSQIVPDLKWEQWHAIISEANKLGVLFYVIAGGEPFLFPRLVELCEEFKDRFFLILTNGTTLAEADYRRLKHASNIAVIVSIEGGRELTDARRGQGVYEQASNTLKELGKIGVLTGISVTVNRMNFKYWTNSEHIDHFIARGVRIGAFIECIPIHTDKMNGWTINDGQLMLTKEERTQFRSQMLNYRSTKPIYIVHSPGDEEFFGGCVSAGRGFAHVTPRGDLTPCPVSNLATHNLTTATLRDGLASQLFKKIRESKHLLETRDTPCALFAHPKELDELAREVGAYQTNA